MTVVTVALHVLLLGILIHIKTRPVRVNSAGMMTAGIAAYVPGPVGAAPAAPKAAPAPKPRETTLARAAKATPREEDRSDAAAQSVGTSGVQGTGQPGSGPVRLGSGGSLTLMNRVQPIYPAVMQSARLPGQVVLDAIIHPDGTIGDIKVLQSTNAAFAQAAVDAVRKWRYTAIGFEGIVTVTVNFTLTS